MNKSVVHYISELLFLHDCVIVPGFGGFIGNRKSAQLNKITGSLIPPSKQILFNTNLTTNDGLLIAHIASQEEITQEIAKRNVTDFANKSNAKLNTSKVLRIDKIGLFTLGKEGNIIYLQDSSINYSLDAFGLQPTYQKPIDITTDKKQQIDEKIRKIKSPSNGRTLLRAAAVIIPLITLSYLSISQQEKINSTYKQLATLNPFSNTKLVEEASFHSLVKEINIEETTKIIEPLIIPELIPAVKDDKYYIIGGAFSEKKNANRMVAKLNRSNYNAEIIEGRLLRVSYDSFNNREDAILALTKIKQSNPDAWLLKK
ncbi:MAG: hypothetical protein CMD16_01785 [Flavobacteriales bacterium]|nr:hypothetical protein [Flavobacteriales bacterium]|tara:strand:- start:3743 stop:4687 length:945 start_codon:yes stop_codon:yes gene_type:complete